MANYPNTRNFITTEIGGDQESTLRSILFDLDESTTDSDTIGIDQIKRIIWFSADWPLFVDPGISALQNLIDYIIDDQLAIELMQAIEADNLEYQFNDETNELIRIPLPKGKLF